jgi:hypothetical protein
MASQIKTLVILFLSFSFLPSFSNSIEKSKSDPLFFNCVNASSVNCYGYSDEFLVFSSFSTDSCVNTLEFVRETITNYIQNGDELIYDESFTTSISKVNKSHGDCYFPGNQKDVSLFYSLGDSILLEKAKYDERAMKLIIEIYLLYKNSAELSEYYGTTVIPRAAMVNTVSFVKVLSGLPEKDADKCIRKLRIIENTSEVEAIKSEICRIEKSYHRITNKINQTLPSSKN